MGDEKLGVSIVVSGEYPNIKAFEDGINARIALLESQGNKVMDIKPNTTRCDSLFESVVYITYVG